MAHQLSRIESLAGPIVCVYEYGDGHYTRRQVRIFSARTKELVQTSFISCKYLARMAICPNKEYIYIASSVPDGVHVIQVGRSDPVRFVDCDAAFAVHVANNKLYVGSGKGLMMYLNRDDCLFSFLAR
jgi:hypothetical protein